MDPNQTSHMLKKPLFWLLVLLSVFALKGAFVSALLPLFQAPDEQLHYATIQYRSEPEEKTWPITNLKKRSNDGADISTYGFSEEVIMSAQTTQFDEVKFQNENTQEFSKSDTGLGENEIIRNNWKQYVDTYPVNASGTTSVYYDLGVGIERWLADESILARFFSIRLLSVAFGAIVVFLSYLTAKKIGFTDRNSLIMAALVAFQPMLSATAAQVNIDIALILAFSFFIYAAVSLLKSGFSIRDIALLLSSIVLGLFSKGPGVVLVVAALPLIAFLAYDRFRPNLHRLFWQTLLSGSLLIASVFIFVPQEYLVSITNLGTASKFDSPLESLSTYTNKTLGTGALLRTEASYWGNFGWLDTQISNAIVEIITLIELISLIGIGLYLFSRTDILPAKWLIKAAVKIDYLPEKKYIIFFIGIILLLQLAIRFYDWRVFDAYGKIYIGTPGRYFLPNVLPHILLMVSGLGFFAQSKKRFDTLLKASLILMVLLSLYAMVNVIIPRYYL